MTDNPQTYDPSAIYDVRLAQPVRVGRATIRPLGVHQITGETLNAIVEEHGADAVASAERR
ncbi:MAG TPA: hypothetical protein VIF61_00410 [Methylocystis sp.]|jgi:hypothetical protein